MLSKRTLLLLVLLIISLGGYLATSLWQDAEQDTKNKKRVVRRTRGQKTPFLKKLPVHWLQLPKGFSISVFARVPNARSLALGSKGTIFVSTRSLGKVFAIVDKDGDHRADEIHELFSSQNMPNGVSFRDGSLYIAEVHRVVRLDNIESHLKKPPKPIVINDTFPRHLSHGWKFIRFGPDGWLYVPVGVPCNICEQKDPRFGTIMRMKPDGSNLEIFAQGVRNSVGFDFHPTTQALWFTDNGRDWMGDDLPPCELNHAPKKGMHFGFPHCHGGTIPDPEFAKNRKCSEFTPPAHNFGAHVAPLGMRFYNGTMFPKEYSHQIFVAQHGSWNRSKKVGYQVILVRLQGDRVIESKPFISGWLRGQSAWGRPVDVMVMPDGALLVSDDHAGAVYRITYNTP